MELLSKWEKMQISQNILWLYPHIIHQYCVEQLLRNNFISAFFDRSGMGYSSSVESFFFMFVAESMTCIPVNQLLLDGNISVTWLS